MEMLLSKAVRLDQLHEELIPLNLVDFTGLSAMGDGPGAVLTIHAVAITPAQEQAIRDAILGHVPQPTAQEQAQAQLAALKGKPAADWQLADVKDAITGLLQLLGM